MARFDRAIAQEGGMMGAVVQEYWPWKDATEGQMWKPRPGLPSIRNNKLWEIRTKERMEAVKAARQWKADAEADGWVFNPTYAHEPEEQAFRSLREKWVVLGIARLGSDKATPSGEITVWAPNGGVIKTPIIYPGWEELQRLAAVCPECGAVGREMARVAFANLCCVECEPGLRAKLETPGWNR